MIILIESGATKSDWRIVDGARNTVRSVLRPGMNVSTMRMEEIARIIRQTFETESFGAADGLYLYTAGVVTPQIREELTKIFRDASGIADIDVQDDLVGAARAVCGHEPGIAAIMGTGSNACFWDGVSVSRKVYSGGFILGDEGGAATLGKLFVADYIKGLVPSEIASEFEQQFDASYASLVENIYRGAAPSGYLGSIAPFVTAHIGNPYMRELVEGNFRAFARRLLAPYDTTRYEVGIVGGFAWATRDILLPILEEEGVRVRTIMKAPVEGLCKYHCEAL